MRVIILAAGMGNRLGMYTQNVPKCMLYFANKFLLEWQVEAFRRLDIDDIVIVTGYQAQTIKVQNVTYRHNARFESTNMVESLLCARDLFDDEVIVSYADVLIEDSVLKKVINYTGDVGVVVDINWKYYWKARYGRIDFDTESLSLDQNGFIKQLGVPDVPTESIDGRYVGVIKFSKQGICRLKEVYEKEKLEYKDGHWRNSRDFDNGYMTDLLQALIDAGQAVKAIKIHGGWLEFDTEEDYEMYLDWLNKGILKRYLQLEGIIDRLVNVRDD